MVESAIAPSTPSPLHEPTANASESSLATLTRTQWVDLETVARQLNQHFGSQGITVQARWKQHYLVVLVESLTLPEVDILLPQVQQALEALKLEAVNTVHVYARLTGEANPLWGRRISLASSAELQTLRQPMASPTAGSVADWLNQGAGGASQILAPIVDQSMEEQRFLRCCLGTEENVLIPLVDIQSIFTMRLADIVPVPHMPEAVLGVHHYRGEMLWMVDLDAQLGLGAAEGPDDLQLTAIVIQQRASAMGFVTQARVEIETQPSSQIHGLDGGLFPSRLTPYLSGYLQGSGLPVLNVSALLNQC